MNVESLPFRAPDTLTPAQRIWILDGHVTDAMADGRICRIASEIAERAMAQACAGRACDLSTEGLQLRVAQAILSYVQRLGYRSDPDGQEWYQGPIYTLRHGGDCEDLSVVFVAMARCAGIDAALYWITQDGAPLNHVSAKVRIGGRDLWAEATVTGAMIGENPIEAARRAGQSSRLGLAA